MFHRQRTAADRAVSRRAAPGTGHQRRVPGARHLNKHWSVLQGAPQCSMSERWDAGRSGSALPVQLSRARRLHARHDSAHNVSGSRQALTPSLLDE